MSAMHWEARRRQSALDRRMARDKQQLLHRDSDTTNNTTQSSATKEQAAGSQCPHCKTDLNTTTRGGAKIPNRYSSLQYTQQW